MNTHVRDDLRYLKGLDGVPVIESGLTIDNTDGDERLLLPLLSTAECTTVLNAAGEVAYDEQTNQIKEYDGTAVRVVISEADVDDTPVNGATTVPVSSNWAYDFINTLTTQSDLPYATAAGAWARLAKGTGSQYLRMNSGATAPEWATVAQSVATSTFTGNNTEARQITTGFICKVVILIKTVTGSGWGAGAHWLLVPSGTVANPPNGVTAGALIDTVKTYIHATNGFVVDSTSNGASNDNGGTYYYFAFG